MFPGLNCEGLGIVSAVGPGPAPALEIEAPVSISSLGNAAAPPTAEPPATPLNELPAAPPVTEEPAPGPSAELPGRLAGATAQHVNFTSSLWMTGIDLLPFTDREAGQVAAGISDVLLPPSSTVQPPVNVVQTVWHSRVMLPVQHVASWDVRYSSDILTPATIMCSGRGAVGNLLSASQHSNLRAHSSVTDD